MAVLINVIGRMPVLSRARDGKGFTLIEMMMALLILSVSVLALTSVTITAIRENTKNYLRNTTVQITKETIENILAEPFESVATGQVTRSVPLRGTPKDFEVAWTVSETSSNLKAVSIRVETNFGVETIANDAIVYKHSSI